MKTLISIVLSFTLIACDDNPTHEAADTDTPVDVGTDSEQLEGAELVNSCYPENSISCTDAILADPGLCGRVAGELLLCLETEGCSELCSCHNGNFQLHCAK
jgi:hypothetical protein